MNYGVNDKGRKGKIAHFFHFSPKKVVIIAYKRRKMLNFAGSKIIGIDYIAF